jgi:hypothetical protein
VNIFITLDYELFFADFSGSVENSITRPTYRLLDIVDKFMIKLCFFVDAGYLVRLKKYKDEYPSLQRDYEKITNHIKMLHDNGHDIQLHIHPHWEDTIYNGEKWEMNTTRYRIHSFSKEETNEIVKTYKKALTDLVGENIFAYRAGGWCIQPFSHLKDALKKHNIWLDSTLYNGGFKDNSTHYMDFRNMPNKTQWQFESDPMIEVENGFFTEVPISSTKVSPLFYIRYALLRKFDKANHKIMGDGKGVGREGKDSLSMLTKFTPAVASIDGYRLSYLQKTLDSYMKIDSKNFVIMGHPKALTRYSIDKLHKFLAKNHTKHNFTTYKKEFLGA